jgi:hypothetical protein
MPQKFKALLTVTIWLMFIFAWGCLLSAFITGGIVEKWSQPMHFFVGFAISVFFAFGGGFLVLVRKKLE